MPTLSDKSAELLYEFGSGQVGTGDASELANRARRNARRQHKICDVNRDAILVQGTRNRENDARYPTQDKNRTLQRIPCLPTGTPSVTGRLSAFS